LANKHFRGAETSRGLNVVTGLASIWRATVTVERVRQDFGCVEFRIHMELLAGNQIDKDPVTGYSSPRT
jgi:hypothetical protein